MKNILIILTLTLFMAGLAAKEKQFKGRLSITLEENHVRHEDKIRYHIRDEVTKKEIELKFSDKSKTKNLKTGYTIEVKGQQKKNGELEVAFIKPGGSASDDSISASRNFSGVRSVLFVSLNFLDVQTTVDLNVLQQTMFGAEDSVNSIYIEASNNISYFQSDLTTDYRSVNLNINAANSCGYRAWADLADTQLGKLVSHFDHVVYFLPLGGITSCWFEGVANLACTTGTCRTWVYPTSGTIVLGHELGHNLGFGHAAMDKNNDGIDINSYGDLTDIMGNSRAIKLFNAAHMKYAGWTGSINLNSGDRGKYIISSLADYSSSLPKILMIPRETLGNKYNYYFSFRNGFGEDETIPYIYKNVISIHYSTIGHYSILGGVATLDKPFVDLEEGIGVRLLSVTSQGAELEVFDASLNDSECYDSPFVISGDEVKFIKIGGQATYNLIIKNNDSYKCAARELTIKALISSTYIGVSCSTDKSAATLAPQATTDVKLTCSHEGVEYRYVKNRLALYVKDAGGSAAAKTTYLIIDIENPVMGELSYINNYVYFSSATDDTGIERYDVYRRSFGGSFELLMTTIKKSFIDPEFLDGISFEYYVKAIDKVGNSSDSNIIKMVAPLLLAAIRLDSALLKKNNSVSLKFVAGDSYEVSYYNIYRYKNGVIDRKFISSRGSFTDSTTLPDTTYTYSVSAITTTGQSTHKSNSITVTTSI